MIPSQDRGWEGMMARRSPFEIRLTAAERDKLELTARKYTLPHREVVRAKIVLYAADGLS